MSQNFQIVDANTMIGANPAHRLDMSVERLVGEMDKQKIAAGLTLSTIGIFHSHILGNTATIEEAKANNRLVPMATINPVNYFGSSNDLQAIRGQGFRIFKFFPIEQGWSINSATFGGILKQLAPLKTPIMLDAPRPGDPSAVGRMVSGYTAPVVLCAVSIDVLSEALAVMSDMPNVMIETHELHAPGALEMIASRVGADRIIFGSAAPRRSIASSLYYIISSELSDEDKQRVLGGNIKRILEGA